MCVKGELYLQDARKYRCVLDGIYPSKVVFHSQDSLDHDNPG